MEPIENRIHIGSLGPGDIALLRNVADEAAAKSVHGMMTGIGLDPNNPIESQKCFVRLREMVADPESRTDMDWTRRTRKRTEGVFGKAILTLVALATLSAFQTMWLGLKSVLASAALLTPH